MPTDLQRGSFADVIATATRGAINDEATSELKALVNELLQVQRLRGTEPKGKISLVLSMELNKHGVFEIDAEIKVSRPKAGKTSAFLYATREGTLAEEDYRQGRLDLDARDVSTPGASNVRSIEDRRMAAANDKT